MLATKHTQLSRDVKVMRRAIHQIDEGKGQDAGEFFDGLRAQSVARKTAKSKTRNRAR
jgi:hypothetical protein